MLAIKEKFRSNMNITRIDKKEGNYTRISNDLINDSRLSLKEKGIMLHILSKPDNWILNVKEISNSNPDGEKSIYSGIKKLKELGYINLKPIYGPDKKITSWVYYINESPSVTIVNKESELLPQNLQVGKLQVGIRQYNNTNSNKTKYTNTPLPPKKVFENKENTKPLNFEAEKEKKEVRKQLLDLGVKAAEKLINISLEDCKKRLSYIPRGASTNPFEIYQDILNGSPLPDAVKKIEYHERQREFNIKFNPIARIWNVDITKPEKDRKIDFITQLLLNFQRLYKTKGDIEIREKRYVLQEKLQKTIKLLDFKELIEMIDIVYFKKEYSLSISDKSYFEELSKTNFTLSNLEKEISKMIEV